MNVNVPSLKSYLFNIIALCIFLQSSTCRHLMLPPGGVTSQFKNYCVYHAEEVGETRKYRTWDLPFFVT